MRWRVCAKRLEDNAGSEFELLVVPYFAVFFAPLREPSCVKG
jgi:hypothetical protein